jgi:hypothetical protein
MFRIPLTIMTGGKNVEETIRKMNGTSGKLRFFN